MEAQAAQALSEMLREWENLDVCLWKLQQITITTVAGTASYTISTDPAIIDIEQAAVVESSRDYPLEVMRWRDYNSEILDKTAAGRPDCIAVQRTTGNPVAYMYPVPDAVYSVRVLAVCRMKDYDTSASTPDFPVDFEKAMSYGLAKELSFEYPGTLGFRQAIADEAERAFTIATAANRESCDDSGSVQSGFPSRR